MDLLDAIRLAVRHHFAQTLLGAAAVVSVLTTYLIFRVEVMAYRNAARVRRLEELFKDLRRTMEPWRKD